MTPGGQASLPKTGAARVVRPRGGVASGQEVRAGARKSRVAVSGIDCQGRFAALQTLVEMALIHQGVPERRQHVRVLRRSGPQLPLVLRMSPQHGEHTGQVQPIGGRRGPEGDGAQVGCCGDLEASQLQKRHAECIPELGVVWNPPERRLIAVDGLAVVLPSSPPVASVFQRVAQVLIDYDVLRAEAHALSQCLQPLFLAAQRPQRGTQVAPAVASLGMPLQDRPVGGHGGIEPTSHMEAERAPGSELLSSVALSRLQAHAVMPAGGILKSDTRRSVQEAS